MAKFNELLHGRWQIILKILIVQRNLRDIGFSKPKIVGQRIRCILQQRCIKRIFIMRTVYAEVPPKVEYSLTEYGRGLHSILQQMHDWGVAHLEHMAANQLESHDSIIAPLSAPIEK